LRGRQRGFDNRLDRREPGTGCKQDRRTYGIIAQKEVAERRLDPEQVTDLGGREKPVGEYTTRLMTDVQFKRPQAVDMRRACNRVRTAQAIPL
jgi:hypothetical protein